MCGRNIHTYKPHGLCGWALLFCTYIPCLLSAGLIALNVLPYHFVFLPYLSAYCTEGGASWLYYYYCLAMMVFAEVMVYGNFALAIFTAPGFVPQDPWREAPVFNGKKYSGNPFEVTQLDRSGKLRYCSRCEQFKPDNAHHCAMCERCVYRFDHFCPMTANAIGRDNSKYFFLFLGYIPVGAFHIVLTTAFSCYAHFTRLSFGFDLGENGFHGLLFILSILFSTAMGVAFLVFALHFFYMVYRGETSISSHIARTTVNAPGLTDAERKERKMKAELNRIKSRDAHMYDVFGTDQRWLRMLFCFKPVQDERGLVDQTMPTYSEGQQKLV